MAGKTLKLQVVTPERIVYSENVDFVSARGVEGELGILPDHAPLITTLDIGLMKAKKEGQQLSLAVIGGFLEVANNKVTVLADRAEVGNEVDVARARAARERAQRRLTDKSSDIDSARAEMALKRALIRLRASGEE